MSNRSDSGARLRPLSDEPGFVDGIPVEELVRLTREFTARITNEDRQRLQLELTEGGRSVQAGAPYLLQQFFTGKISLDVELARRFPGSPMLASASFNPAPGKHARRGWAQFKSQDEAASLTLDLDGEQGTFEVSFLLGGMIGVTFAIGEVPDFQRARFLDLMRRPNGIAILWTRERWERDYLIFVVRERFARMYAFGQGRHEAACRLAPDVLDQLMHWLGGFWLPGAAELASGADS
jgi:hypothetical protein